MTIPVASSIFMVLLCIMQFKKNYHQTKNNTKIFYKYHYLFHAIQWVLIALMNVIDSILLIPIVIALVFIQIKISKSIHDSSKNNKQ